MEQLNLTKRQLELIARACLHMAADEETKLAVAAELDELYDLFTELAEEVEEQW